MQASRAFERAGLVEAEPGTTLDAPHTVALAEAGAVAALECGACAARHERSSPLGSVVFVVETPSRGGRTLEVRCARGHVLARHPVPASGA